MDGIVIATDRLFLREWLSEDFRYFKPIATNPQVMQYIGTGELWSDERINQFINNHIARYKKYKFCFWALVHQSTQTLIGICGLSLLNEPDEVEIGWWLTPDYWGKGLATEAAQAVMSYGFERLTLPKIISIAQPVNQRSIRVMEKLGMHFEKMSTDRHGIEVVYYAKDRS
ncbi:MAG TPA: GNAT family N-acetyltransferase [Candidatus Sericytochromatia bacterium]